MRLFLFFRHAFLLFMFPVSLAWGSNLLITEVYANAPARVSDTGKEWLEIYNASDHPIALAGLMIRRIDGAQHPQEAWRVLLQQSDIVVAAGGYAIIAQSPDLGLGLCPQIPIHVVADEAFSFKNSGVQQVCVQQPGQQEHCVQFSDSKTFPDGQSRHLPTINAALGGKIADWVVEDCPLPQGAFGSPGFALGACYQSRFSQTNPWYADWVCPDSDAQTAAVPVDGNPLTAAFEQMPDEAVLALVAQPLPQLDLHVKQQPPHHIALSYEALTQHFSPLVRMDLYASVYPNALGGILIAAATPVPTQVGQSMQLIASVRALPKGNYYFFVHLQGVQGNEAYRYAPESIAIDNTATLPNLRISQANMQSLTSGRAAVHVSWDVEPAALGTLTLYARDTTAADSSWQPIVTGLPNQDAGGKYVWRPPAVSAQSSFELYGLLRTAHGSVTSTEVQVVAAGDLPSCQGASAATNAGHDAAFVLLWVVCRTALGSSRRRKKQ